MRFQLSLLSLALVAAACAPAADVDEGTSALPSSPVGNLLQVGGGDISGELVSETTRVRSFKGIPYAAPPVGDLRWRAPQPAAPWQDALEAKDFSAHCWQPLSRPGSFYGSGEIERSEDCLYLNVWTAAETNDAKRPVMVWIHGGGLRTGSGASAWYDGSALAEKGVVLVTINYRLGPMGFLAHPELSAENQPASSGNYGILDQIAALEWVQSNIAAFGGDPGNVTIFGESAGSWSICYLVASPLAKGLLHRAIGESGGVFAVMPELEPDLRRHWHRGCWHIEQRSRGHYPA